MLVLFLPRRLRTRVKGEPPLERLLNMLFWTLMAVVAFVVAFRFTEGATWNDSIWQAWQTTTTVGYGDGPAKTTAGRIAVIVLSLGSIALLGATFSAMFDYRAHVINRRRQGLVQNPHRDGYVIVQYPGEDRLADFIREVRSLGEEKGVPVCVIDRRLDELPGSVIGLPKVHYVRGSLLSPATFEQAAMRDQRTIVVFPPEGATDEADGTTASIVGQIERYLGPDSRTELIYVLIDEKNQAMFEGCRARPVLKSLDVLAVVQEAQDPHSARVLSELLSNTHGANPVTAPVNRIAGWTWGELYTGCPIASKALGLNVSPLALIRGGDAMVAPPP
jgi:voltage-gated potassium channel